MCISSVAMKIIFSVIIIFLSIIGFIFYSYLNAGCSVPLEYQKGKLLNYLSNQKLDAQYLTYDPKGSTECRPSFIYKSATQHIHFVLVDGGQITSWNYNEQ